MRLSFWIKCALRIGLLLLLGVGPLAGLVGCSAGAEPPSPVPVGALQDRFPAHVGEVRGAGAGFVRTADGFVARPAEGTQRGFRPAGERFEIVLPGGGGEGLVFRGAQGFAPSVREVDAMGEGALEGSAVTYARPGGRSYWTATAGGVEEWLLLEAEQVTREGPVAVWEVGGATLRQRGDAVELLDEHGQARIAVTAPRAYAEGGRPVEARLAVSGARLELFVEASAEAVLVDPVWVGTGDMKAARTAHSATLLADGQVMVAGGGIYDFGQVPRTDTVQLFNPVSGAWTLTTPMLAARGGHTATLLPNGKVLVVGGEQYFASAEIFDPTNSTWTDTFDITFFNLSFTDHTATLLQNGTVLIANGYDKSALIFNPSTATWAPVGAMIAKRSGQAAALLPNGKVLISGGNASGTAEIFDPSTATWAPAGVMSTALSNHTATALPSGKVLVVGGAHAEVYDPAAGTWLPTNPPSKPRSGHNATLLPDGRVLISGGAVEDAAEIYDPVPGVFVYGGRFATPRAGPSATLLQNGQVLVAGGTTQNPYNQFNRFTSSVAELFDPAGSVDWTFAGAMLAGRTAPLVTPLQDGTVLIAGGDGTTTTEIYDPASDSFTAGAPMKAAHGDGDTVTQLKDGRVLVAGGGTAEIYDPAHKIWELTTGPMIANRTAHTATLLENGWVLITGGLTPNGSSQPTLLNSAELYDPDSDTFTATPPMGSTRYLHTATLLDGDKVLVMGGNPHSSGPVDDGTAEIYDRGDNSWGPLIPTGSPRQTHVATRLASGKVLIMGGDNLLFSTTVPTNLVQLFDPGTGSFASVASMVRSHKAFAAALLPSGHVLVAGGLTNSLQSTIPTAYAETYDPTADKWTLVGEMAYPRGKHSAVLLPDGHVLVVGGTSYPAAEIYDAGAHWARAASMPSGLVDATATLLLDGQVLVAGGTSFFGPVSSAVRYDAQHDKWLAAGSMGAARAHHTATRLSSGEVLIAGGAGGAGYLASAERYDLTSGTFVSTGAMSAARIGHTATLLSTGEVLIAGGLGAGGVLAGVELYDPAGTFSPVAPLGTARWEHTASLSNGKVLIVGGRGANGILTSAALFDPAGAAWTNVGNMVGPRTGHTATSLAGGKVLIAGGTGPNGPVASAELYDPSTTSFSSIASMLHARTGHVAFLLANGQILVAGGQGPGGALSSAEAYDPASGKWLPVRSLNTARRDAAGTSLALADGRVLALGGTAGGAPLASAELFSLLVKGALCDRAADCGSGFCADTICCDEACSAGPCKGCSVFTGALQAGTCAPHSDIPCDDHDACTQTDTCQSGVCVGASPISCPSYGPCHDPSTCKNGVCSQPPTNDNLACSDSNACTQMDICQGGECKGGTPVVCDAPPAHPGCHEPGICDTTTGVCSYAVREDGTPCDDGDKCTVTDVCQGGLCQGTKVTCAALDECHNAGTCDPADGMCSNPPKDDGAKCKDGDECTVGDTCQMGVCTGAKVVCHALNDCHNVGTCDPMTGDCSNPAKDDGATCDSDGDKCTVGDTCQAGDCKPGPKVVCQASDQCHNEGTCDPKTGKCNDPPKGKGATCDDGNTCTDDDQCQEDGVCRGTIEINCACPECAPYVCFGASRSCKESCASVSDCATGYVCEPLNHQCVPPPDTISVDDSGCAVSPGGGAGGAPRWPAALSLLALGALAGQRRAGRRRVSATVPGV